MHFASRRVSSVSMTEFRKQLCVKMNRNKSIFSENYKLSNLLFLFLKRHNCHLLSSNQKVFNREIRELAATLFNIPIELTKLRNKNIV